MKYLFACLLFLTTVLQLHAQEAKDYKPYIKLARISLTKPLTLDTVRARFTSAGFKESPDLNTYFEQDLYHKENSETYCKFFRNKVNGIDLIYEAQYLPDGRVYRMNCYFNFANDKYSDGTVMMAMKIAYNNSSKQVVEQWGMPTKYIQQMVAPFTDADYKDDDRCALALRSNNLIQSARWISKTYEGTEWANTPTIEMSMHTLKMIKYSVTDIELLKLSKEKPY